MAYFNDLRVAPGAPPGRAARDLDRAAAALAVANAEVCPIRRNGAETVVQGIYGLLKGAAAGFTSPSFFHFRSPPAVSARQCWWF